MTNFSYLNSQTMRVLLVTLIFIAVTFPASAQLTYKDVAGIFYARCTSCHHEGGAGPFPFMTYSQTVFYNVDIVDALNDGFMPPWSPDTTYSRFLHERIITDSEKNAILDWIANGAPAGDTTLAPPPPAYIGYQLNGTPTLELQIPTFTSNAVSSDSYVCFSLPTNLAQDRYLRAFEVVPGNASIVHHVLLNVDTLGTTVDDLSGTCYTIPGDFGLGGFAPGAPPTVFPGQAPLKLGILIKAGSKIVLQMHYPAGSAGMIDSTKVRFYFYPVNETGIRPVAVVTPLQNWNLLIPPDSISTFSASFVPFPIDISILATFPHSHLLCSNLVNYAHSGTDTIPLIRINEWDFEWQGYYNYRYPVKIPAGYILEGQHTYDNTVNNPNNPNNPPQFVIAGLNTTDEMFFDSFQLAYYLPGDENIDIASLLANDTLLVGVQPVANQQNFKALVYPNPASDFITFHIEGIAGDFTIDIFTIDGKLENRFQRSVINNEIFTETWNPVGNSGIRLSPGVYLYKISGHSVQHSGKIVLLPGK